MGEENPKRISKFSPPPILNSPTPSLLFLLPPEHHSTPRSRRAPASQCRHPPARYASQPTSSPREIAVPLPAPAPRRPLPPIASPRPLPASRASAVRGSDVPSRPDARPCVRAESDRPVPPFTVRGIRQAASGCRASPGLGTDNGGSCAAALHVARRRVLARGLRKRGRAPPPASSGAVPRRRLRRHVRPAPRPRPHRGAAPRVGALW